MKTNSKRLAAALLVWLVSGTAVARKDFDGLNCGVDIAQAMVGRKMSERKVSELQKAYASLRLKDLGNDELKNGFNTIVWSICGDNFLFLGKGQHVLDAVRLPPVSEKELPLAGSCKQGAKGVDDVLAVLRSDAAAGAPNVMQAWQVDYKKKKLTPLASEGLLCPAR